MLKNITTKKNTLLTSISFIILFVPGFCFSVESHQPEVKGHQPESNNIVSETNIQQVDENISQQEQAASPAKKPFSFFSRQKEPASEKKEMTEPTDALTVSLGLMFILLLIFSLAWIMRKTGYGQLSGQGTLSVIATLNLGQKEKIALIKVGQQQILVGITATQINTLSILDEPLDIGESDIKKDQSTIEKNLFSKKLNEVLNSSAVVKKA